MSENIESFEVVRQGARSPRLGQNIIRDSLVAQQRHLRSPDNDDSDLDENDFHRVNPVSPTSYSRNGNNDLIETDDELLEVGSNEHPDGSDDEEDDDDRDDSNLSRPLDFTTGRRLSDSEEDGDEYFRPLKRLAEDHDGNPVSQIGPHAQIKKKGVKSFCIDDILSHKTAALQRGQPPQPIVRPWDRDQTERKPKQEGEERERSGRRKSTGDSPLDALFNMASNFEALKAKSDMERAQMSFASKQPPKKKRKSRTAFTNHQIFELEKRFLYQKYLSPADRDEIAAQLGLSNAQVICWFQNRRAKFKRDMEELKKDVEKSPLDPRQNIPRPNLPMPVSLHHPIPTSLPLPSIPHPLLCLAPHLLPASIASQCRSPMGSPDACSPPIRVEDSD